MHCWTIDIKNKQKLYPDIAAWKRLSHDQLGSDSLKLNKLVGYLENPEHLRTPEQKQPTVCV